MKSKVQNIPVITNISIEPFLSQELSLLFQELDSPVEVTPVPYMEYRSYGDAYGRADMVFIWLNLEAMVPDLDNGDTEFWKGCISDIKRLYQEISRYLSEISQANIIIALFEHYSSYLPIVTGHNGDAAINGLNRSLMESLSGQAAFLDLMHIIASVGISNAYSAKNRYRWNYPYSQTLTKAVAAELYKRHLIDTGNTKKCVVVDCDNVLWGGILSEDGMDNLKLGSSGLGREHQDFQRFLLSL